MPLTIAQDRTLWISDKDGYHETNTIKRKPLAYFYMNRYGSAYLELTPENKYYNKFRQNKYEIQQWEEDKLADYLRLFCVDGLDCQSKMEGYTWLPEWTIMVRNAVNKAFPTN